MADPSTAQHATETLGETHRALSEDAADNILSVRLCTQACVCQSVRQGVSLHTRTMGRKTAGEQDSRVASKYPADSEYRRFPSINHKGQMCSDTGESWPSPS